MSVGSSPQRQNSSNVSSAEKQRDSWSNATLSAVGSKHVLSLRDEIASASALMLTCLDVHSPPSTECKVNAERKRITPKAAKLMTDGIIDTANADNSMARLVRVLIVDDSPICRKVLQNHLEKNGYSTDTACDGEVQRGLFDCTVYRVFNFSCVDLGGLQEVV